MNLPQNLIANLNPQTGRTTDWQSGSYTDETGQSWYWDALHGWVPQGMTYGHPTDPAVIKKYFRGSKPTVPPPPLLKNQPQGQAQNNQQGTPQPGRAPAPGSPDLASRLNSLIPR